MEYDFAALRFTADENLRDNLYWYGCAFSVAVGEKVLAPVGVHNRLQCAETERTLHADEKDAPYDVRLIKWVRAKYGARKLVLGGCELLEFGGVRYDSRHYTPFGRLLLTRDPPDDMDGICGYGITKFLQMQENGELYEEIAKSRGGVLLAGEAGRAAFARLYKVCRGQESGLGEELSAKLRQKLL